MPVHHIVLLKFKDDAPPSDVERYVAELAHLPRLDPDIDGWVSGPGVTPPFHNGDFDFGMACTLPDESSMERYMAHPAHRRLAPFLAPILERQIAFDFVVDETPAPAGTPPLEAPSVDGLRIERARAVIKASGKQVGQVKQRPNPYWAEGFVLAHREVGDSVDLVVSSSTRVGAGDPFEPVS